MFYHENSVTKALMDLFPEIVWDKLQLRFPSIISILFIP